MTAEPTITPATETSKSGSASPKSVRPSKKAAKPATKKRVAKSAAGNKSSGPKFKACPDSKKAIVLDLLRRKQGDCGSGETILRFERHEPEQKSRYSAAQ